MRDGFAGQGDMVDKDPAGLGGARVVPRSARPSLRKDKLYGNADIDRTHSEPSRSIRRSARSGDPACALRPAAKAPCSLWRALTGDQGTGALRS
jgi:hypothetical protein